MTHQKIISQYMSTTTPYDGILLFHYMGSGKTCSAIAIAEKIKSVNNNIKGVLVLAGGPSIINNIVKEIVYRCTDGKYIPTDIDQIIEVNRLATLKRNLKPFYEFNTFETFINAYKADKKKFHDIYSNYVIIIDEIHRLPRNKDKDKCQYTYIHEFLHSCMNKKVILLSGTPMTDKPSDIADVMNLILPLNNQMPQDTDFNNSYIVFDKENNRYTFNTKKLHEFKEFIKGRISYLKSIESDAILEYQLNQLIRKNNNDSKFTLYYLDMLPKQYDTYNVTYQQEITKKSNQELANTSVNDSKIQNKIGSSGLHNNSRQAILAIFPDGSYGSEGSGKYINPGKEQITPLGKITTGYKFQDNVHAKKPEEKSVRTWLNQGIAGLNQEDKMKKKLDNLRELSVKYADVIEKLLKNSEQQVVNRIQIVKVHLYIVSMWIP